MLYVNIPFHSRLRSTFKASLSSSCSNDKINRPMDRPLKFQLKSYSDKKYKSIVSRSLNSSLSLDHFLFCLYLLPSPVVHKLGRISNHFEIQFRYMKSEMLCIVKHRKISDPLKIISTQKYGAQIVIIHCGAHFCRL